MKLKKRKRWSNSIKNHKTYPLTYFIPESEEEIQQIIKEAELYQLQVRAVGSGHSFSDVAITNDYLIDMRDMNHFLIFRSDYLKRHAKKKKLVQVQSGITFRDLNRGLDARKLSLVNMSAIDQQTISGAISTATHGSGNNLLDLSGMVRSIEFISDKGIKFKLEPKNGITDPRRYHADAKLLQEDNLFFAALISLGCFGIVTSYILEVEEEYWLTESQQLDKWSIVKKQLQNGSIFERY
ncbi:MAG: FAD-binding protein, partial [Candidatus Heimdallarchaeota archaeon]